jgi:hypothetical protein
MTEAIEQVRFLVRTANEAIRAYEQGNLPLDRLTTDLNEGISALQGLADPDWVEELHLQWLPLEYASAVWIAAGGLDLDPEERKVANDALDALKALLVEY